MAQQRVPEEGLAETEENVVIKAGDCLVTLMPALGGKIASLRVASHELLQSPLQPLCPRTPTMDFSEADASGWDECLPSVAACTVQTEAGPAAIPDHGDVWRIPWRVLQASQDSATMRAKCFSLPLEITRSLIVSVSPTGWRIQMLYSLTNLGAYKVPWSWSAHPLFAVEAGDRIHLPAEIRALRLEGSAANRLGNNGASVAWPQATTSANNTANLSLVSSTDSGIGDKLFAGPIQSSGAAWCVLERPGICLRLTVRFEPLLTPYLGLWLCYGGWPGDPNSPGLKQFCVAPEPATAPVDSLAEQGDWSRWLDPGETATWPMEVQIDRMTKQAAGEAAAANSASTG
jgi:galactose mutarotase-like enzyme